MKGIPLQDYRRDYYTYTGKAGDIARTLGLSAIAIVWVFKTDGPNKALVVPAALYLPTFLAVVGLTLDLLQYVTASAIWGIFARAKEKSGKGPEDRVTSSPILNWPTLFFFWGKLALISLAYWFLLSFLWKRVVFGAS